MWPFGRRGESTVVSSETEVEIPFKTFVLLGLISNFAWICTIVFFWFVALGVDLNIHHKSVSYWWRYRFVPMVSTKWPFYMAGFPFLWVTVACAITLYRFFIEQWLKSLPDYLPWDSSRGPFMPFAFLFGRGPKRRSLQDQVDSLLEMDGSANEEIGEYIAERLKAARRSSGRNPEY